MIRIMDAATVVTKDHLANRFKGAMLPPVLATSVNEPLAPTGIDCI